MCFFWNDKQYKTYIKIKEEYGFTDSGAIDFIENCLENKCLYVYVRNNTHTLIERCNLTKLPRSSNSDINTLLIFGKFADNHYCTHHGINNSFIDEHDGTYHDADHLMFFEEELSPRDLVLRTTNLILQNNPHELWEKALEELSFFDQEKHKRLLMFYKVDVLGVDKTDIQNELNISRTKLYTLREEGKSIAKELRLPLPNKFVQN